MAEQKPILKLCRMYIVFTENEGYFAVNAIDSVEATAMVESHLGITIQSGMVHPATPHSLYRITDSIKE